MSRIFFITHDGESHEAALADGQSLMHIATRNGVPGIDGDCGGVCACGTCHVIVDSAWTHAIQPIKSEEAQMLSMTPERQANSRLACQLKISSAMDGFTVHLPEFQM